MFKDINLKNLSTYGAKALFYINVNDDPPFKFQETLAEGSELPDPFYSNTFKIPGEYTITGIWHYDEFKLVSTFS